MVPLIAVLAILAPVTGDPPQSAADLAARLLGSPLFGSGEFNEPADTALRIVAGRDAVAVFLRTQIGPADCGRLRALATGRDPHEELAALLAGCLNGVLVGDADLFTPQRFAGVALGHETVAMLRAAPHGPNQALLRRRLLEDYLEAGVRHYAAPQYTGLERRGPLQVHRFGGSCGTAEFDARTGTLAALYLEPGAKLAAPVGLAAAERAVRAWLQDAGLTLQGWTRTEAEETQNRNGRTDYRFVWRRLDRSGVAQPGITTVDANAAGQVVSVLRVDRESTVTDHPAIDRATAGRAARDAVRQPAARVVAAACHVWFDELGQQELRWRIVLDEGNRRSEVLLNAQTGAVIHIAHPEGLPLRLPDQEALAVVESLAASFDTVEILTAYGPDGTWWRQAGISPHDAGVRLVGRIRSGDPRLGRAIASGLAKSLRSGQTGVAADNIPWFWLRWRQVGEDSVIYSNFHPLGGVLQFERRERESAAAPAGSARSEPTRMSVVCRVPGAFSQAIAEALEPGLRAEVLRRLPRRRSSLAKVALVIAPLLLAAAFAARRRRPRLRPRMPTCPP